jgi:hypothetical protein
MLSLWDMETSLPSPFPQLDGSCPSGDEAHVAVFCQMIQVSAVQQKTLDVISRPPSIHSSPFLKRLVDTLGTGKTDEVGLAEAAAFLTEWRDSLAPEFATESPEARSKSRLAGVPLENLITADLTIQALIAGRRMFLATHIPDFDVTSPGAKAFRMDACRRQVLDTARQLVHHVVHIGAAGLLPRCDICELPTCQC